MFIGVKSCAVAGAVALAAGVITFAPIDPPATEITPAANSSVVELGATPSPFQFYPELIARSLNNLATLGADYLADPLPITRATIENQLAALDEAFTALRVGDGAALVTAVADIVAAPIRSATSTAEYLGIIADQPGSLPSMAIIAISPLLSGLAATRAAVQDVIDAVRSFDVVGLLSAVLNVPGRIVDGMLNGGYPLGGLPLPGLISPVDDVEHAPAGPIASLLEMTQDIGSSIRDERDEDEQLQAENRPFAAVTSEGPAAAGVEPRGVAPDSPGEATDPENPGPDDDIVAEDLTEVEEAATATDDADTESPAAADGTPRTGDKSSPRGPARHENR
ncbi:hypothetical protein [Mycobacterium sp. SMC-4]|uniref:hypothetical protein n=1 Tax=Mycobacterium sp. SMC-4 TaxID=2857059 RepID=UPI003D06D279